MLESVLEGLTVLLLFAGLSGILMAVGVFVAERRRGPAKEAGTTRPDSAEQTPERER